MHADMALVPRPIHDLAGLPIISSAPVRTGRRRARTANPSTPMKKCGAEGRHAGDHLPGDLDRNVGLDGIEQEQRPDHEGYDARPARRCRRRE